MSNILIINFDLLVEQYIPILQKINTLTFNEYSIITNNILLDSNLYKIITNYYNKALNKNSNNLFFYKTLNSLIPILQQEKNIIMTDISYNDIEVFSKNNIDIERGIWLNGIFSPTLFSYTNNINSLLMPNYTVPPMKYDNIYIIGSFDIVPESLYNYFYLWIDLAANKNNIQYKLRG